MSDLVLPPQPPAARPTSGTPLGTLPLGGEGTLISCMNPSTDVPTGPSEGECVHPPAPSPRAPCPPIFPPTPFFLLPQDGKAIKVRWNNGFHLHIPPDAQLSHNPLKCPGFALTAAAGLIGTTSWGMANDYPFAGVFGVGLAYTLTLWLSGGCIASVALGAIGVASCFTGTTGDRWPNLIKLLGSGGMAMLTWLAAAVLAGFLEHPDTWLRNVGKFITRALPVSDYFFNHHR